jgi:Zn-dependent protease
VYFWLGRWTCEKSLKICTIPIHKGISLYIHYTWPIFLLISYFSPLYISSLYALYSFILGGPILFLTVLIHELGHCLMAIRLNGDVNLILLWPLGGVAYISFFGNANPKADILIAIAGPLTHIPQIIIWYILLF